MYMILPMFSPATSGQGPVSGGTWWSSPAGRVVKMDVSLQVVVVGNPARLVRHLEAGDEHHRSASHTQGGMDRG